MVEDGREGQASSSGRVGEREEEGVGVLRSWLRTREEAGQEPSAEPLGADLHRQIAVAAQLRRESSEGTETRAVLRDLGDGGLEKKKEEEKMQTPDNLAW
jgi:hypothetical protein